MEAAAARFRLYGPTAAPSFAAVDSTDAFHRRSRATKSRGRRRGRGGSSAGTSRSASVDSSRHGSRHGSRGSSRSSSRSTSRAGSRAGSAARVRLDGLPTDKAAALVWATVRTFARQEGGLRLLEVFREFDRDRSGAIDLEEFTAALHRMGIVASATVAFLVP
jgi:hypothetical protein